MSIEHRAWTRQGEAFWRAHHEAWKRSDLNQRHYCEVHGLPQKAFENWRQKFRAEPQPPERRLLYCQSAPKFDPRSASNFDPLERRVRTVALAPSELVRVAETARARVVG